MVLRRWESIYNRLMKCYQPSLKDKLAIVNSLKADVAGVSPLSIALTRANGLLLVE